MLSSAASDALETVIGGSELPVPASALADSRARRECIHGWDRTCSDVRSSNDGIPNSRERPPLTISSNIWCVALRVTQVGNRSATPTFHHGNGRNTWRRVRGPFNHWRGRRNTECALEPGEFSLERVSGAEPPSANDKSSPGPTLPFAGRADCQDHRSAPSGENGDVLVPFTRTSWAARAKCRSRCRIPSCLPSSRDKRRGFRRAPLKNEVAGGGDVPPLFGREDQRAKLLSGPLDPRPRAVR